MGSVIIKQNSFGSGEIEQKAYGRNDLVVFKQGLKKARNILITSFGSIEKRHGTRFLFELGFDSDEVLLIDYEYNDEDKYLIILKSFKLYVYKEENDNLTLYYECNTPYNSDVLINKEIKYATSQDKIVLVNKQYKPMVLEYDSNSDSFDFHEIDFKNLPTYDFKRNYFDGLFKISDAHVGINKTLTCDKDVFTSEHVNGMFLSLGDATVGSELGVAKIKQFIDSKTVKVDVVSEFDDSVRTSGVKGDNCVLTEPIWSDSKGYPGCCVFHQSRLFLSGSKSLPNVLIASCIDDFFNFDTGTGLSDEAFLRTIATSKQSKVINLISFDYLYIFTLECEYVLKAPQTSVLTPKSAFVVRIGSEGSGNLIPVIGDDKVFFAKSGVNSLYGIQDTKIFPASLFSFNIFNNPVDMDVVYSYKGTPFNYIFIVNSDGDLIIYQIFDALQINAFSLSQTDNGFFKQVSVVGNNVYFVTKRNINGEDKTYLEKFDNNFYLDCFIEKSYSEERNEIDGLEYLEQETVSVFGKNDDDWFFLGDTFKVENGKVTVNNSFKNFVVGKKYISEIETLPLIDGELNFRKRKLNSVFIDYYKSIGLVVEGKLIKFRQFGEVLPYKVSKGETGIYEFYVRKDWEPYNTITITAPYPFNFVIRSIGFELVR